MAVAYGRFLVIKYLYPFQVDQFTFITRIPRDLIGFNILIKPFSLPVWLCIFISYFCFIVLDQNKMNRLLKRTEFNNESLFWICIGILFCQPHLHLSSARISTKTIVLVWLLSVTILSNFYSGHLSSMLAIPSRSPLDTVEKLMRACISKEIIPLIHRHALIFQSIQVNDDYC